MTNIHHNYIVMCIVLYILYFLSVICSCVLIHLLCFRVVEKTNYSESRWQSTYDATQYNRKVSAKVSYQFASLKPETKEYIEFSTLTHFPLEISTILFTFRREDALIRERSIKGQFEKCEFVGKEDCLHGCLSHFLKAFNQVDLTYNKLHIFRAYNCVRFGISITLMNSTIKTMDINIIPQICCCLYQ